ncbi:MAG: response regulator [Chloroflexaceae bacterium]|nr:response regulator [Chloroflexaceae bacterium]
MIVDDDRGIRRVYAFFLASEGYTVIEAEDGMDALNQLAESQCDVVVTDMCMPRMGGLELIKALREQGYNGWIIVITAHGTPDTREQAMDCGADRYITKPFPFEELEECVRVAF